jgi:hypothetical protein
MKARRYLLFALTLALAIAARATSVIPPDFSDLVNGSDYIVRARVKAMTGEIRLRNGHERIYTNVELEVLEVIAGTPPSPLVLTMLGGKSGTKELKVAGAPKFAVGNEDILFVQGNGKAVTPLYAMMHGQYPVLYDKTRRRTYVCRSNLVPLQDAAEVALPLAEGKPAELLRRMVDTSKALSPEEFIKSIKQTRQASSTRAKLN